MTTFVFTKKIKRVRCRVMQNKKCQKRIHTRIDKIVSITCNIQLCGLFLDIFVVFFMFSLLDNNCIVFNNIKNNKNKQIDKFH